MCPTVGVNALVYGGVIVLSYGIAKQYPLLHINMYMYDMMSGQF